MPECPICGGEIMWDDTLDDSFADDEYIVTFRGYCPDCEKYFIWTETYIRKDRTDLVEDE